MAVQRFKVALNNARLPLVSTQAQRAVFIPGLDSAPRTSRQFTGTDDSIDYNLAQVIFSENVMPVAQGISSVGYITRIPQTADTRFDSIFPLRDENENVVLFSPAAGQNYTHDQTTNLWTNYALENVLGPTFLTWNIPPADCKVTYCYVEGFTFVCYGGLIANMADGSGGVTQLDAAIWFWNPTAKRLEPADVTKITNLPFGIGTVTGIGSSSGNLIVYSGIEIAWAPFNGTLFDFSAYANNAFTGAGVQTPEDIQGTLTAVISMSGGFLAFTSRNCIAATYHAQNLNAPWIFREVAGAGGIESYEQATVESSLATCYAYTTAGLQKISLNSAELTFPAVSDFIAGRYIERISSDGTYRVEGSTTTDLFIKLTAIGNRYVVVSYGTIKNSFTHALVYDIGLDRWGKLRINHRDCFQYTYGNQAGNLTYIMVPEPYSTYPSTAYEDMTTPGTPYTSSQHAVAFMQPDGKVLQADWSGAVRETRDEAVAIIGRIQLTRTSNVQFNRVELDGARDCTAYITCSTDGGDNQQAVDLILISQSQTTAIFGELLDAKSISIGVVGTFQLSSLIIEALPSGRM